MAFAAGYPHPDYLKRVLTIHQYQDLVRYWNKQPRGDARQDFYNALLRWQMVSMFDRADFEDYLPPWANRSEDSDEMGAEELYMFLKELNQDGD